MLSTASTFLKGKKTYIGITAGAAYATAISIGVVPSSELVWTAIASWTGFSVRSAISDAAATIAAAAEKIEAATKA